MIMRRILIVMVANDYITDIPIGEWYDYQLLTLPCKF